MSLKILQHTIYWIRARWDQFTFSDVSPLIQKFSQSQAQLSELENSAVIKSAFLEKTNYPIFANALQRLRNGVFGLIIRAEKKSFWRMFFIHIFDVHLSIAGALISVQILKIFESPTARHRWLFAGLLAGLVFFVNIAAACLHAQKIEREMMLVYRIQMNLTKYIYAFLLRMSRQDKAKISSGDIVNLAQADSMRIAEFFAHAFVDFPVLFFSVFVIVSLMCAMLGRSALLGLALLLLQIPLSMFFAWLGSRLHKELMKRSDTRISLVTEWISGMRLVRYFGWSRKFEKEIKSAASREFLQEIKLKAKYSLSFGLSISWWMVVCLGIFYGFTFFSEVRTPSKVFGAIWLTAVLGQQLNPLPWFVSIYSEATVGARRIQNVFKNRIQEEEFDTYLPFDEITKMALKNLSEPVAPEFVCENVSVVFDKSSSPALSEINIKIPAGKITAVVGPIGSGKSVLLQLLMGDIVPSSGTVKVKFNDLSLPLHHPETISFLQKMQTFVPQEAFVASATLRENIPLIYFDANDISDSFDNRVMNSIYAASLGEDMKAFSHGLATELGERGVNLSGGQKQRLSMARSAFSNAKVIFLDDPLSAVDSDTEKELAKNLLQGIWNNQQTVVWSTHRMAFLHLAELVVVLEEGRVVEQGTFAQLAGNSNSRLHNLMDQVRNGTQSGKAQ